MSIRAAWVREAIVPFPPRAVGVVMRAVGIGVGDSRVGREMSITHMRGGGVECRDWVSPCGADDELGHAELAVAVAEAEDED